MGHRARARPTRPPPAPSGIGELDELGAALAQSGDRIRELLQRERSFSSHVAHQLRTPVTAMRVAVEAELDSRARTAPRCCASACGRSTAWSRRSRACSPSPGTTSGSRRGATSLRSCASTSSGGGRATPSPDGTSSSSAGTRLGLVDAVAVEPHPRRAVRQRPRPRRGPVAVQVRRVGGHLEIDVRDDGRAGLTPIRSPSTAPTPATASACAWPARSPSPRAATCASSSSRRPSSASPCLSRPHPPDTTSSARARAGPAPTTIGGDVHLTHTWP